MGWTPVDVREASLADFFHAVAGFRAFHCPEPERGGMTPDEVREFRAEMGWD